MKRKTTMILTTVACLAPILLGLYLYDQLPDMVPIHFNAQWEPDGWSAKPVAVFGLPCLMAALNFLMQWGMGLALKKDEGRKVAPEILMTVCYWIPAVISLVLVPMTLLMAIGREFPMDLIMHLFLGVTFLFVGNYLPKCKMNGYIGIKLPWTYSSDENWRRTHRLGGFVWVIAGIVMLMNAFLGWTMLPLISMTAAVLVPSVYSYLLYRNEKK